MIRPSERTFIAARESTISPTATFAPLRSRNVSERSERCHDCLATCVAMALTEFDRIIALRKPRCSTTRRIRSSSEMPHRSVSASGESATINSGGREGSGMSNVESVLRSFVIHNPVIADACDWIHEMRDGRIVESHRRNARR